MFKKNNKPFNIFINIKKGDIEPVEDSIDVPEYDYDHAKGMKYYDFAALTDHHKYGVVKALSKRIDNMTRVTVSYSKGENLIFVVIICLTIIGGITVLVGIIYGIIALLS